MTSQLARYRIVIGMLLIAQLAACGSSNKSDSDPQPAPPVSTATPTPAPEWRGVLQSVTDVAVVTKFENDAAAGAAGVATLAGPALCDVRVRSMVHSTVGPRGEVTKISGALLVPQGAGCAGPYPIVAYARATSRDRTRTLADPTDRETSLLINFLAARGFIVVGTDYLGFAGSDFSYHPYLDAESEATSVIDSIRAARSALRTAAVPTSGKIFLAGYSQGAHSALAAQREIERTTGIDIAITGTGAMSGPYDLALTIRAGAAANLLPSIPDESNVSNADRVRNFFADSLAELAGVFVNIGPVADALARESVIDFKPLAPVLLCGGARDLTVPFANTTTAAAAFSARGSTVSVVDIDTQAAFATLRPAPDTPADGLRDYHNRVVPPLCLQVVRERLLNVYR
jgi:pimeloyl-ACP methyl ester carboxylesterase